MIFDLDRRYWSVRSQLELHRDVARLGIGATDLVIDVGSGQNPHPRANVLCDLFVRDNTERASGGGLRVDRPLVVADATRTPFADGTFDFVFCSHLLEHMEDPGALLRELQRIARAGYIETPSPLYERLYGWRFHRWLVGGDGERLRLEAKTRDLVDEELHDWFEQRLAEPRFWRAVIPRLRDNGLLTRHVWRDEIDFEIIGQAPSATDGFTSATGEESDGGPVGLGPTVPQRVKSRFAARARRRSDRRVQEVFESLRCPTCGTGMTVSEGHALCPSCGQRTPVLGI